MNLLKLCNLQTVKDWLESKDGDSYVNDIDKLPARLERALKLVLDKPDELYIQKDMRELLRRGFLKIGFGTGLALSELGVEYIASQR